MPVLRAADERRTRIIDGVAALWCVLWLVIGGWTGYELWQLSYAGATIQQSGRALDDTGRALQDIGRIPVIGTRPAELGNAVRQNAAQIQAEARRSVSSVRRLAILLGLAVAVIPNTPVLAVYLPERLARRRERRDALHGMTDAAPGEVDAVLAVRAVAHLPYADLRKVSETPGQDLLAGHHHRRLAEAELRRLGLRRSSG